MAVAGKHDRYTTFVPYSCQLKPTSEDGYRHEPAAYGISLRKLSITKPAKSHWLKQQNPKLRQSTKLIRPQAPVSVYQYAGALWQWPLCTTRGSHVHAICAPPSMHTLDLELPATTSTRKIISA